MRLIRPGLFRSTSRPKPRPVSEEQARVFVTTAYRLALQRVPDPQGLQHYVNALLRGEISCHEILTILEQSQEATQANASPIDPETHRTPARLDKLNFYRPLKTRARLKRGQYDSLLGAILAREQGLIIGQGDYIPQHRERFWEMFTAIAWLLRDRPAPRILELGVSEFSALYQKLIPGIRLDLADRPAPQDYIGFTETVARDRTGCENYYAVDLEGGTTALEKAGIPQLHYDLIVFAEILEHLVIHPRDLLPGLLERLKEDGLLYLTTPNYLRRDNLRKIARGRNPQDIYPAGDGNWDRHYHHREYTALELSELIENSGGRITGFYYSDCWDSAPDLEESERANMVFVIARQAAVNSLR